MATRSTDRLLEQSVERRGPGLKALVCFVRILVAVGLLLLLSILSETGGVLNRFRGGFIDLSSFNSYWLEGDLHRELFSIVTGILVVSIINKTCTLINYRICISSYKLSMIALL